MSIAVDVVTDDGAPNAEGALRIVEAMKQRGVIISTSGLMGNTLKIRPLLIYTNEETTFFIEQIQSAVRTVF
jgi:4-aminobutyrate aminotransferase-like enzyme